MVNELSENKYPQCSLPSRKVKVSFYLYVTLTILVILIIMTVGLNVYLITSKTSKLQTVSRDPTTDFSSTYLNIRDAELPIGTDILLNPMLKDWSVRVTGVVVKKNIDSFVLENIKNGYIDKNIEIKKCPDGKDVIFKIFKDGKLVKNVDWDQLNVGMVLNGIGRIIQTSDGGWSVCAKNFIIDERR